MREAGVFSRKYTLVQRMVGSENQEKKRKFITKIDDETVIGRESMCQKVEKKTNDSSLLDGEEINKAILTEKKKA
jgi:hypothetical protein